MAAVPELDLYIAGARVPAASGRRLPVVNPATEETIGSIPAGGAADVDAAVAAAHEAFPAWAATPLHRRTAILKALAEQVRQHKDELSRLETLDMGKPLDEAAWDMDDVADCFDFFGDLALKTLGPAGNKRDAVDVGAPEFRSAVLKQPAGVAGLITPWNYPLLMATWKLAPALAAGCAVVLKPSEHASLTCLRLADLAAAAGVPPGALNVVTGLGADTGAPLAAHAGLQKLAFTGSNATGRSVARAAAANLTPCTLELGGKSAVLVFEDADIDKAVEWVMFGCFWTNGQICSATSRLLVQRSVAPKLLARLKARAESIQVGDPLQEGCRLGPVVCGSQYEKVQRYIRGGVEAGAALVTGGPGRPAGLSRGYYTRPTVFSGVTPDMAIWREEIFGPVLSVMEFDSEAEAVALANGSEFGLAGAVISSGAARNKRVSAALEVGIVWVNCSQPCFCQAPWGGRKASGIGRELGTFGLDNFLAVKQVTEYVSPDIWDWYSPPQEGASKL